MKTIFLFIFSLVSGVSMAAVRAPVPLGQWDTSCIQKVASTLDDTFLIQDFVQKVRDEVTRFDGTLRGEDLPFDDSSTKSQRRLETLLAGISGTFLLNGDRCIRSTLFQLVDLVSKLPDADAISHPLTQSLVAVLQNGINLEASVRLYRLGWDVLGRARAKKDPTLTDSAEGVAIGAIRGLVKRSYMSRDESMVASTVFLEFMSAGLGQRGRVYPESAYTVILLPALEKLIFSLPAFEKSDKLKETTMARALLTQTMANIDKGIQQALRDSQFLGNGYNSDLMLKGVEVLSNIHCYVGATTEVKTLIDGVEKVFARQNRSQPRLAVAKTRYQACDANTGGFDFSFVTEDPYDSF